MIKVIRTFINSLTKKPIFFSLSVITFYYFITYFSLIPHLGFYSEDVFVSYIKHFWKEYGILQLTSIDRPSHGYLLNFLFMLFGDNVLSWHIYTSSIRLVGGYLLFFLLNKIWPNKIFAITLIILLFLTYPGFLQQTLPIGYSIWITTLTIWILSLLLTAYAIIAAKNKKKYKFICFLVSAVILQTCSLLLLEYFIGIEISRIFIIIYLLNSEKNIFSYSMLKFFGKIFIYWKHLAPYLIAISAFLFWRIFIFKGSRDLTDIGYVTHTFYTNPVWIAKIPLEIIHSFLQTVVFAYFVPFAINFIRIPIENSLFSLLIGFSAGSLIYLYIKKMEENSPNNQNDSLKVKLFGKQLLFTGIITIICGLIPIVLAGRFIRVYLAYDRYTLGNMFGVAFIIVGFLLFKFKSKTYKLIFIFLLSLSIASQLMNGYYRVQNWESQKEIWWQLYWRSPHIKDNAMLIFYFPEMTKQSLFKDIINKAEFYRMYWVVYQISSLGNLFFNYQNSSANHFNGDYLSDKGILQKIQDRTFETVNDSTLVYQRNFDNSVIISTPGDNSCLWVFDNKIKELPEFSNALLESSVSYSDATKLVKEDSASIPPTSIFGKEPPKNWCYYFQKASLARQQQDWFYLSKITNEALSKKLQPSDINEWLPFIEGYIVSKKYNQANNLLNWISQNYQRSDIFNTNLCKMSKRLPNTKILDAYCK